MFLVLIERAGITRAEFARRMGLQTNTVYNWGNDAPGYAIAYLNLMIDYNRVRP